MKLAELKSEFHRLIDETNDPQIIEQFYDAMNYSVHTEGNVWQLLTADEQQGVIDAYEHSKDASTLTTLEELKRKYANWS